ncbi:MAG: PorV/PorQ family protein [candidate division WOR-3 bacterium]
MSRFLKLNLLIITILILSTAIYGDDRPVGFKPLNNGIGAREVGMGGTGVTSAEGGFSFYFNPALSGMANKIFLHLSYTDWFLDTYQSGLFFLRPTKFLNLGFGLIFFDYGKLELRSDKPEDPVGEYSPKDLSLYFNLARSLSKRLSLGTSLRYFYERIYQEEAKGWGLDLGLLYQVSGWRIGFSYLNWGDVLKFKREAFYLPASCRLGISRYFLVNNFSFWPAFDLTYSPYEKKWRFFLGGEVNFKETISFRFGYAKDSPTFGLGLKWGIFQFDYSGIIKKEFPTPCHYFTFCLKTGY